MAFLLRKSLETCSLLTCWPKPCHELDGLVSFWSAIGLASKTKIVIAPLCALTAQTMVVRAFARHCHERSGREQEQAHRHQSGRGRARCSALHGLRLVDPQAEQVQAETLAKYGGDRVEVCVAARDIDVGETLDETNVITQEWLTSLLPRDAATELRQVRGDVTTSRIPKNAVICNVYTKAESHKLEVPKGKVAVSVAVDAEHSVGGATGVGSYVDVYVQKDGVTDRLCGAHVIDTSENSGATREGKIEWVTLAADPEDVKELLGASGKGTVSLTIPATARGKKSGGDE